MNTKKVLSFAVLVIMLLNLLTSCGIGSAIVADYQMQKAEKSGLMLEIKKGRLEYNGSVYYQMEYGYLPYIGFFDHDDIKHSGEVIGYYKWGEFFENTLVGYISKTCEADFGDNILKISDSYGVDYALKEDFSLPSYQTLKLDAIYFNTTYWGYDEDVYGKDDVRAKFTPLKSFSDSEVVYLGDIVDFETYIERPISELDDAKKYSMSCTLKDFDTIYLGEGLVIFLYENEVYMSSSYFVFAYRVNDDYKELFKEKIVSIESQTS